jgi:hypothetical protein
MSSEKSNVVPINEAATQPPQPPTEIKPAKSKPTQVLPTDRIVVSKQLNLLRAYAAASTHSGRPVKIAEVADVARMSSTAISITNGFLLDTGLIQRTEQGFLPSQEVLAFAHAHEWNAEKASHKLAPLIGATWFAKRLLPKLAMDKIKEEEAITDLAAAAAAGKEYKNQIKFLIDYMEAAGIVQREGDYLQKNAVQSSATTPALVERVSHSQSSEQREPQHRELPATRSNVSTAFTQMTGGVVQFNISVKVDMAEFSGWHPERIAAFFGGIAQVLAAKGAVEQKANIESLE